jgi:hypothetical protein
VSRYANVLRRDPLAFYGLYERRRFDLSAGRVCKGRAA